MEGTGGPQAPLRRVGAPSGVVLLNLALTTTALVTCWLVLAFVDAPQQRHSGLVAFVVLAALMAAAEHSPTYLHIGRHAASYSFSDIPLLVGLCFVDPAVVIAARIVGMGLSEWLSTNKSRQKVWFNIALRLLETAAAAAVFTTIAGSSVFGPRAWLAALLTSVTCEVVATPLVMLAIRVADGEIAQWAVRRQLLSTGPAAFATCCIGMLTVAVIGADWRGLWMIGPIIGLFVAFQRANMQLQQRHRTLEVVTEFSHVVAAELDTESVARVTLAAVRENVSARIAGLVLDGDGGPRSALWDCHPTEPGRPSLPLDIVTRATEPMLATRGTRDEAAIELLESLGVDEAIALPLRHGTERLGVIVVADRLGDVATFTAADLSLLEALANNAAIALNNGRLADRLRAQVSDNEYQALHDALTGLPNRRLFSHRMESADGPVAVLLLDLDRFKEVNDTLGHQTGDQLLQMVAERLAVRLADARCVTRLGGDEFAVGLDVSSIEEALEAARTVRETLAVPFRLPDMTISVDASVGVAFADEEGDPGTLLQQADLAMYAAKSARTGVECYSPERDASSPELLLMPAELREAIHAGQLVVYYQPKADLDTDVVRSVEALVRWQHPRRGLVPPSEFIPLAEHTGLINALTRFVLAEALTQCRAWRDAGHDISVAVNVSPRTLHDGDFPDALAELLIGVGLPPHVLTLEITEDDVMSEPARTLEVLGRLATMGITLSVDDLGTGYSSLSYLRRLPVHEVKIDRSFVMAMADDPDDEAIVEAIVALGHRLGKRIVAEGVEDERTYTRLAELGCHVAQGYWLSRPLPAGDVEDWLEAWRRRVAVGSPVSAA